MLPILPNLEKSLVLSKMHHLLYFRKLTEGFTEGTMIGPIEGLVESSALGISEKLPE